ncbi:FAD-dependent oxidoreductase [Spirillospora albida]|uniref:FAD-dependent oxidoreductase n=1 Tax=Spirillospora albida TaxID=58123 RepID=UPI000A8A79C3|nr:FAD-dependent oxidoreductase [Spirillospora albida]
MSDTAQPQNPTAPPQAIAGGGCCGVSACCTDAEQAVDPGSTVVQAKTEAGCGCLDTPRDDRDALPVVVIGAGPVGLSAAAHLAERGLDFLVLEAGDRVGASIRQWSHVALFSPWRYGIDPAARRLLDAAGWAAPDPDALPTGGRLVGDYLEPLAALGPIAPRLRTGTRVEAISRAGYDRVRSAGRENAPFVLRVRHTDGTAAQIRARAVIDASGSWATPNVLGATGLPALGEAQAAPWISHALPDVLGADRDDFAGGHTLVAGAGHSAATTLIALAELAETEPGTRVTWAIRGASAARTYGGGSGDQLPARGRLGTLVQHLVTTGKITLLTGFFTDELRPLAATPDLGGVQVISRDPYGAEQTVTADRIVAATGYRPDHSIAAELRLRLDAILGTTPALAPLIDPNEHSCGTVPPHGVDELAHPETGYYAIGVKSYGRAPTFLLATGYEQARSVVAALAGDWDAARAVELDLPETGVCSADNAIGLGTGISGGLLARPLATANAGDRGASCCG